MKIIPGKKAQSVRERNNRIIPRRNAMNIDILDFTSNSPVMQIDAIKSKRDNDVTRERIETVFCPLF